MNIIITIGGSGTRLKCISPIDKHLLYYKNKRIIEWIEDILPDAKIIGQTKTNSRYETLYSIKDMEDCLIIDCDIIPFGIDLSFDKSNDLIFVFTSNKNKWGSIKIDDDKLINASETDSISNIKCSGAYFIKNINTLLNNMTNKDSIASGMIGASIKYENTFLRFGDIEDYKESIKI
jgi:hypothetical protein